MQICGRGRAVTAQAPPQPIPETQQIWHAPIFSRSFVAILTQSIVLRADFQGPDQLQIKLSLKCYFNLMLGVQNRNFAPPQFRSSTVCAFTFFF